MKTKNIVSNECTPTQSQGLRKAESCCIRSSGSTNSQKSAKCIRRASKIRPIFSTSAMTTNSSTLSFSQSKTYHRSSHLLCALPEIKYNMTYITNSLFYITSHHYHRHHCWVLLNQPNIWT